MLPDWIPTSTARDARSILAALCLLLAGAMFGAAVTLCSAPSSAPPAPTK